MLTVTSALFQNCLRAGFAISGKFSLVQYGREICGGYAAPDGQGL
jgi:hypothetical protein